MASPTKRRVFVDTNVLFAALHSTKGPPALLVDMAAHGRYQMVLSQRVLRELIRVVERKLPSEIAHLRDLVLTAVPEIVANPAASEIKEISHQINAQDAPIIAAAIAADVDYFITGDQTLRTEALSLSTRLRVLSPRQLLDEVESTTE